MRTGPKDLYEPYKQYFGHCRDYVGKTRGRAQPLFRGRTFKRTGDYQGVGRNVGTLQKKSLVTGRGARRVGRTSGFVGSFVAGSLRSKICSEIRAHFPPRPGNCLRVNRTGTVYVGFNTGRGFNNAYGLEFSSAGPIGRSARCIRTVRRSVG